MGVVQGWFFDGMGESSRSKTSILKKIRGH